MALIKVGFEGRLQHDSIIHDSNDSYWRGYDILKGDKIMKIYVVSARCDTELEPAMVFKTREEAERCAHDYVYNAAKEMYENYCDVKNPTDERTEKWAERNGYELWDYYWWDGGGYALEAEITEVDI